MDNETGEATGEYPQQSTSSYFDVETGEIVHEEISLSHQNTQRNRSKFIVPKAYLAEHKETKKDDDKCYLSTQEAFTLTSKKKVIELKEVIITKISSFELFSLLSEYV
jgi:hypothetical protein